LQGETVLPLVGDTMHTPGERATFSSTKGGIKMFARLSSRTRLAAVLAASALSGAVSLAVSGFALADGPDRDGGAVKLLTTIPYPSTVKPLHGWDISWVDQATQKYYLADRSNASVDVFDVKNNTYVKSITVSPAFAGVKFNSSGAANNDISGPNGVVVSGRWLFVTDAPSRVVAIDLTTDTKVSEISTGGTANRADEVAFDPVRGLLLAVNNADDPPFATLIQVNPTNGQLTILKKITFDTAGGVNATNGAEQPVWDRGTDSFYISIPQVGPNFEDGAVARINPHTQAVDGLFPVKFCQPAGLTLGPNQDLLLGCGSVFDTDGKAWSASDLKSAAPTQVIMDARTGAIDKAVAGAGGSDEVWFNRGDGRYYTASRNQPGGPVLGVIDARSQSLVQIVPTVNVGGTAFTFPAGTAHSVAVNSHNNHALVPLAANNIVPNCLNGCLAVYGTEGKDKGRDDRRDWDRR
jgi:hypothetical protein